MTRGDARELAVHLIYAREFTGETPEDLIRTRMDKAYYLGLSEDNGIYADRPGKGLRTYIDAVVAGVAQETEALNEYITKYSIGWDVSRISRLARAVMQLAIYEVLHMEDVPTGVAKWQKDCALTHVYASAFNSINSRYLRMCLIIIVTAPVGVQLLSLTYSNLVRELDHHWWHYWHRSGLRDPVQDLQLAPA